MNKDALRPIQITNIHIQDFFWSPRIETNRTVTIPSQFEQCKKTGRLDAFDLTWKPGQPDPPHIFWDSDLAKWVEAASYAVSTHLDEKILDLLDLAARKIASAQQSDGYLNVHYTVVEPEKRWSNLRDCHELYCAGHLIEASVAHHQATGSRVLLDTLCRYADLIGSTFGPQPGQKRGYCGHEEIELALVKLFRATGQRRYLDLAKYFVDERGRQPHYYDSEARERGEDPGRWWAGNYAYCQAHQPVREQREAVGHSVRAMYLYSAMTDLAAETGDAGLKKACLKLWEDVTQKKLYVHGGVGANPHGEAFASAYDLPEETAYAETCASIGLVFWAHRMTQMMKEGRFADVMELALYNSVMSGVSLDGLQYFYGNPLTVVEPDLRVSREELLRQAAGGGITRHRKEWFGCACCPPNVARLIASLGQYACSVEPDSLWVHLYMGSTTTAELAGETWTISQDTRYPWDGTVTLTLDGPKPGRFSLCLRIPGWCRSAKLTVAGTRVDLAESCRKGYAHCLRTWKPGEQVELQLSMPVERVYAHASVRQEAGNVALMRGPVVYCIESVDHPVVPLERIAIPRKAKLMPVFKKNLLGGIVVIEGTAQKTALDKGASLYSVTSPRTETIALRAVPYCVWDNRKPGSMRVWMREG